MAKSPEKTTSSSTDFTSRLSEGQKLQLILRILLFTPGRKGVGLPMIFWCPPGVAKTSIIEKLAQDLQIPCEVLSPGERGEGAFGCVPVPVTGADGLTMLTYPMPEWTKRMQAAAGGLVFVDELNTAAPALQPVLQGLLNEKRIGGGYLGPKVRMLGCSNPVEQSASGFELTAPVANRSGHMPWPTLNLDDWALWMLSGGTVNHVDASMDPDDIPETESPDATPAERIELERKMAAGFAAAYGTASALLTAYVKAHSDIFHKLPALDSGDASRAWPSPRTWEFATRAYAGALVLGAPLDVRLSLVRAYVGEGACKGLMAYVQSLDLPDPMDILDGKIQYSPDPKRPDRTMVTLNSCAAAMVRQPEDERFAGRLDNFVKLMQATQKVTPDMVIPVIRVLRNTTRVLRHPNFRPIVQGMTDILRAAGLSMGR